MTESEVSDAFDAKPTRRRGELLRGVPVDVVRDTIGGPRPGAAIGLFEKALIVVVIGDDVDQPVVRSLP